MTSTKTDHVIVSHRQPDPPTGAERAMAVRVVAGRARDADDCALLLAALGLNPTDGREREEEQP